MPEQTYSPLKVLVVQRRMTHYRVPFFEALRLELERGGISLILAYGEPTTEEASKGDSAEIAWAHKLPTRYLGRGRICLQPYADLMEGAQAVVVTPENKLVNNLWTQLVQRSHKVILWGHGANLQGNPRSWRESVKRLLARRADWWLGYTEMSRELIGRAGFPQDRITILDNAVDTLEMSRLWRGVSHEARESMRSELGITGNRVGIFVGSLYENKRIDFLLESALRIRASVSDFELLIVGSGPLGAQVQNFCDSHAWAHFPGMLKGEKKVQCLSLATVMLNPGLVGLGILDSFVCEVPMITTDCGIHSPEISYLDSGVNGLMVADSIDEYASSVTGALLDESLLGRLRAGCGVSARRYTVENMAKNFSTGVTRCLQSPAWR